MPSEIVLLSAPPGCSPAPCEWMPYMAPFALIGIVYVVATVLDMALSLLNWWLPN
jgi:hypothetical protein